MEILNYLGEIWKDVKGFEWLYQVSNFGRIRSYKKKIILKPQLIHNYYLVFLSNENIKHKGYRIHRLVAEAFIPNPNNLPYINHKDENKLNNCVENLEWCDAKYNANYGERNNKMSIKMKGKLINRNDLSKPIRQYDLDGNLIKEFPSIIEIQRQLGFDNSNISKSIKKNKSAYGFIWRFKN